MPKKKAPFQIAPIDKRTGYFVSVWERWFDQNAREDVTVSEDGEGVDDNLVAFDGDDSPSVKDSGIASQAVKDHLADQENEFHKVTLEQARSENNQIDGDIDFNDNNLLNGGSIISYGRDVIRYSRRQC